MSLLSAPTVAQLDRAFSHFLAGRPYRLQRIVEKEKAGRESFYSIEPAGSLENWSHWQFVRAASTGDTLLLNQLIGAGLHQFARAHETNEGPLCVAARHDWWVGVEKIADCEVDLEASDYRGRTALLVAARQGAANAVQSLLRRGAKLSACVEGNTALHHAVLGADPDRVIATLMVLLAFGADRSAKNEKGQTPLALAECPGREELLAQVSALLTGESPGKSADADDAQSSNGEELTTAQLDGAWFTLLAGDSKPFLECIDRAGPLRRLNDSGFRSCITPLPEWAALQFTNAAKARDDELIGVLLRHGLAKWAWIPETDETALHLVSKENWAEGVWAVVRAERSLLEHVSHRFGAAMHTSVRVGALAAVRALLELGADPNIMDCHGRTPLHELADVTTPLECDLCEDLLRAGAHPGELSDQGESVSYGVTRYARRFIKV